MKENNIIITTGKKTQGEFTVKYIKSGYNAVIPVIDGIPHPELMMGYVSESDRDAGMALLEEAIKASGGDIPKAMMYMYNAAMSAAKGIHADEAVMIDNKEIVIDYAEKKAYFKNEEISNLNDISEVFTDEAVKALLVERAKVNLPEAESEEWNDYDEDDGCEEGDDYDEDDDCEEDDDYEEDKDVENRFPEERKINPEIENIFKILFE